MPPCFWCNDTGYVCAACNAAEDDCDCTNPDIVMCESCPDEDDEEQDEI